MTDVARAAVLTEFGKPLEIRKFPILGPEPGGLVVAVEAATVCGTDVHNWQGHTSSLKPPVVPGHEGVGRIIAFGDHAEADSRGTPRRRTSRAGARRERDLSAQDLGWRQARSEHLAAEGVAARESPAYRRIVQREIDRIDGG